MKIVHLMTNKCQKLCLYNLSSLASCLVSVASRSRQHLYWEVNKFSSWVLFIHPRIGLEIKLNSPFRFGVTEIFGTIFGGGPLWVGPECSSPFDKIVVSSTALLNPVYLAWCDRNVPFHWAKLTRIFCWMECGPCCKLQSLSPLSTKESLVHYQYSLWMICLTTPSQLIKLCFLWSTCFFLCLLWSSRHTGIYLNVVPSQITLGINTCFIWEAKFLKKYITCFIC